MDFYVQTLNSEEIKNHSSKITKILVKESEMLCKEKAFLQHFTCSDNNFIVVKPFLPQEWSACWCSSWLRAELIVSMRTMQHQAEFSLGPCRKCVIVGGSALCACPAAGHSQCESENSLLSKFTGGITPCTVWGEIIIIIFKINLFLCLQTGQICSEWALKWQHLLWVWPVPVPRWQVAHTGAGHSLQLPQPTLGLSHSSSSKGK